ncbi:MAG: DUF2934 domain-containing protein [Methylotenera sp.]|uniref:DUF2934 domain-containing protein n=1 Tax=Methylotenera sp. TaxID=2051956 RepID=UPI002487407A|nr:DUF2934 domain-containing protein [Methylotenera sp.]MDI1307989.1 DUF2934 domain-containing protein [Methylotenera sp.]
MELSTVNELHAKNHIPVFGIESKAESVIDTNSKSEAKSKKESINRSKNSSSENTSDEDKRFLVAESAYYKAQARGFETGYELEDWLAAEAEVMK